MTNFPQAVPTPPPGAILPPGYVPPPPGGSTPAPQMPRPQALPQTGGSAMPAPRQQEQLDPQSIRIQAAIQELEQQCNAVRSRAVGQAAQIAYAEAVIKQLEERVTDLTNENRRLTDEAATAKADLEVEA